jgi:hypothetical protein
MTPGVRQGSGNHQIEAKAAPTLKNPDAEEFYARALRELVALGIPFLLAGTYAVSAYTGISRETKDIDVFCKPGDYPRILAHFKELGFSIEVADDRWLGKIFSGSHFIDVIFAASNGAVPIGDAWFDSARETEMFDIRVPIVGPTELVWSKCFIQNRNRYDGADVAHLLLRANEEIEWKQLLAYMEAHWEVLLVHLLNFRWIYPSERARVPEWLLHELVDRLQKQWELPPARTRICRGRMFSPADYEIDIREWGFSEESNS